MKRINLGCGPTPTPGWENYDNSISVRLARIPFIPDFLTKVGLLGKGQSVLVSVARTQNIKWANVVKRIPAKPNSVDVLYTSHMVEHLDQHEVSRFLEEAYRVLKPNGIMRVVVPDLRKLVDVYLSKGDADGFIASTMLNSNQTDSLFKRLKLIIIGNRHHL